MIRVLLVEDQQLVIDGVKALLAREDDVDVVGLACNGEDAIRQLDAKRPDIVLMDIHMPQVDGINATAYIKNRYANIKVILLTACLEEERVISGLNAGADGFLLKNLDAKRLIRSIRDAYTGQVVLSGEVAKMLARIMRNIKYDKKDILAQKLTGRNIHLSKRELDIAYLLMKEVSNKHMADQLFLSEGTIKNYVSTIYGKLGLDTRKEAVVFLQSLLEEEVFNG